MARLQIGEKVITPDSDAYVIAEIGHNHGGSVQTAIKMVEAAKACGCDAVKFQKRTNTRIYTKAFLKTPYNSEHAYGPTYGSHRDALEFGMVEYQELKAVCRALEIGFIATAFDERSADLLNRIGVDAIKIASGDLVNIPLLEEVAKYGRPVIVSTGGGAWADIHLADHFLDKTDAAFLHCTALYPTRPEDVNLKAIEEMSFTMPHRIIGYSSHFNGPQAAADSYYFGARIIEQHFTLDHTMKGSDHAMSLEPQGMKMLVRDLRRAREMIGTGAKRRDEREQKALEKMEKILWPARTLEKGHRLAQSDILSLSPSNPDGLAPGALHHLIGKNLVNDVSTTAPFSWDDIGEGNA